MQSRDFAYWLQGFFEITEASSNRPPEGLTQGQAEIIKRIPNSEGESGLVTHPTDQGRYTAKEGALATPAEQFRIEAAKPQWWEAAPLKSRSGCSVCGSSVLSQIGR